jgi:hypothetical protein
MSRFRMHAPIPDGDWASSPDSVDPNLILGVVREDIRQTLRVGWIDPALDAVAAQPLFFTAAWSAMRPNFGKSFLMLARAVRTQAEDSVRPTMNLPDLRRQLTAVLAEEELTRIEECIRAAHLAMAKIQIVIHAFHRAVRRDHPGGTGREEPPIRRGIPDWQRWMSFQPAPDGAQSVLDEAGRAFGLPGSPAALRLLARWPPALRAAWSEVDRQRASEAWTAGVGRVRRAVLGGLPSLPHPVELQWSALRIRGFGEPERGEMTKVLATHDAAMPSLTLTAALLWATFGAPEIGPEA